MATAPVEFPCLCMYSIDAPGGYTLEKGRSSWHTNVLNLHTAKVTPSQKLNDRPHEPGPGWQLKGNQDQL